MPPNSVICPIAGCAIVVKPCVYEQPIPREPREQPRRPRATNREIQKWVARQHGFVPETAWIEHCGGLCITPAEGAETASKPCPPEYQTAIRPFPSPESFVTGQILLACVPAWSDE